MTDISPDHRQAITALVSNYRQRSEKRLLLLLAALSAMLGVSGVKMQTILNNPLDEEFSIMPAVPSIYGYVCLPHYAMRMVGIIVAAGDTFRDLFTRLEAAQ